MIRPDPQNASVSVIELRISVDLLDALGKRSLETGPTVAESWLRAISLGHCVLNDPTDRFGGFKRNNLIAADTHIAGLGTSLMKPPSAALPVKWEEIRVSTSVAKIFEAIVDVVPTSDRNVAETTAMTWCAILELNPNITFQQFGVRLPPAHSLHSLPYPDLSALPAGPPTMPGLFDPQPTGPEPLRDFVAGDMTRILTGERSALDI